MQCWTEQTVPSTNSKPPLRTTSLIHDPRHEDQDQETSCSSWVSWEAKQAAVNLDFQQVTKAEMNKLIFSACTGSYGTITKTECDVFPSPPPHAVCWQLCANFKQATKTKTFCMHFILKRYWSRRSLASYCQSNRTGDVLT